MTPFNAKFKVGDVLQVVRRNDSDIGDIGSEKRKNFIVSSISEVTKNCIIYWPTDNERGAYECQLKHQIIDDWSKELI